MNGWTERRPARTGIIDSMHGDAMNGALDCSRT